MSIETLKTPMYYREVILSAPGRLEFQKDVIKKFWALLPKPQCKKCRPYVAGNRPKAGSPKSYIRQQILGHGTCMGMCTPKPQIINMLGAVATIDLFVLGSASKKRSRSSSKRYTPEFKAEIPCLACQGPSEDRHHMVQLCMGGTNAEYNLVLLCRGCHLKVHEAAEGCLALLRMGDCND